MFGLCLLLALAAAPTTPTAAAAPAGGRRAIVGRIVSVDVAKASVVVTETLKSAGPPKRRETVTLSVPPGTPIVRGRRATTLGDVKPQDHVVVRYHITPQGALAESLRVADRTAPTSSTSRDAGSETGAGE